MQSLPRLWATARGDREKGGEVCVVGFGGQKLSAASVGQRAWVSVIVVWPVVAAVAGIGVKFT